MIERVVLGRFRGATKRTGIAFDPDRPITVIFGPNGSGKSTLIDAIEFGLTGKAGSLASRSGVSACDLPALGSDSVDMLVEVHTSGRIWRGKNPSGACPPRVHVLRRHQILALAEATPSEKFDQIRRFVDVSGVQRSEDALKKAVDRAEDQRKRALEDQERARKRIEEAWLAEDRQGAPEKDAIEWAKSLQSPQGGETFGVASELDALLQVVDSAAAIRQAGRESREAVDKLQAELAELSADYERESALRAGSDAGSVTLLREALRFLDQVNGIQPCPICRSATDAADLKRSIEERLQPLSALSTLKDEVAKKELSLAAARESLQSLRNQFEKASAAVIRTFEEAPSPLRDLVLEEVPSGLMPDAPRFTQTVLAARSRLAEARDSLHESVGLRSTLRLQIAELHDAEVREHRARESAGKLRELHTLIADCRREFVHQMLAEVSDECDGFYRLIHPAEPITLGPMSLDANRKASLVQTAIVQGTAECVPQAVLSDSHLDTMGFCFWLALAMRDAGPESILMIDDALTSVDSDHAERVARLLQKVSGQLGHIILATHDQDWLERILELGDAAVIRLGPWSMEEGIVASSN